MIQFRSKKYKILFFVIVPAMILGTLSLLYSTYQGPEETESILSCMAPIVCGLPPAVAIWLITTFFTVPSKPDSKSALTVFWGGCVAGSFFLCQLVFALVLMTSQRQDRCSLIGPNASLWSCNFSGGDLSNLDLTGTDLKKANLGGANLTGTIFLRADLTGADLSGADLTNALFEKTILDEADLSNTTGVTKDMLSGFASWKGILLEDRKNIYSNLAPVCLGERVSVAAPYVKDSRVHPLVLLNQDGSVHAQSANLPPVWWPPLTGYTQLVACVSSETDVLIQTCSYEGGGKARRYVKEVVVQIIEAYTGNLVAEVVVRGTEPRKCPQKLVSVGGSKPQADYQGASPWSGSYEDKLSKYVNPDGEIAPLRLSLPE
jgi:hypothetical protein